jgi:CheY-like chemotaxis protein
MDNKKIVVVDDEKNICLLIKSILEPITNAEVFMAHDGSTGKQLCLEKLPHLVFLDFIMPVERGDKVLEFLRDRNETKKTPVVLMSGLSETKEDNVEKGLFYMPKPFTKKMLLAVTEKILGKF